jgi:hypothetical protein
VVPQIFDELQIERYLNTGADALVVLYLGDTADFPLEKKVTQR